jgi:hypothetical protein
VEAIGGNGNPLAFAFPAATIYAMRQVLSALVVAHTVATPPEAIRRIKAILGTM